MYSMVAAGTGYDGTADSFQFSYQPLSGDGAIIARVTSFLNPKFQVGPGSQGGVMIRSSLAADAPFFAVSDGSTATDGGAIPHQRRRQLCFQSVGAVGMNWVKVVRMGNVFTRLRLLDGVNWAQIGSPQTIVMPPTVYMGLAGNENNVLLSTYITFDHVNLLAGSALWSSSDIGAVSAPGNTSYSGGVYSLVNSGSDIWSNSDQFHYAYLPVTADCSMIACASPPWRILTSTQRRASWFGIRLAPHRTLRTWWYPPAMEFTFRQKGFFRRTRSNCGIQYVTAALLIG